MYPTVKMELLPSYNRQFLQECKKYHEYHRQVLNLCGRVLQEASRGHTKYIYSLNGVFHQQMKKQECDEILDWMLKLLRNKFPDVNITYKEATDLRGNVERGIIIDWS